MADETSKQHMRLVGLFMRALTAASRCDGAPALDFASLSRDEVRSLTLVASRPDDAYFPLFQSLFSQIMGSSTLNVAGEPAPKRARRHPPPQPAALRSAAEPAECDAYGIAHSDQYGRYHRAEEDLTSDSDDGLASHRRSAAALTRGGSRSAGIADEAAVLEPSDIAGIGWGEEDDVLTGSAGVASFGLDDRRRDQRGGNAGGGESFIRHQSRLRVIHYYVLCDGKRVNVLNSKRVKAKVKQLQDLLQNHVRRVVRWTMTCAQTFEVCTREWAHCKRFRQGMWSDNADGFWTCPMCNEKTIHLGQADAKKTHWLACIVANYQSPETREQGPDVRIVQHTDRWRGLTVRAARWLPSGHEIYVGKATKEHISDAKLRNRHYRYRFDHGDETFFVDAQDEADRGPGAYVNDGSVRIALHNDFFNVECQNENMVFWPSYIRETGFAGHNCVFSVDIEEGKCYIELTQNVSRGSELSVDYGTAFWSLGPGRRIAASASC